MKVVAFITIKLNSERVPRKNLQMIGSKPLCYHIINTALQIKGIDEVYVYCSDDIIIDYIPKGAKFLKRDSWLDGNEIRAKDTYNAFINEVDADIYLAMCTTSPFTQIETVENALNKVIYEGYDSAFSAKKIQTFTWYQGNPINYDIDNVPRTQEIDPIFIETSAFFIFKKEIWTKNGRRIGFNPYIQEVGEIESIDIDTMEDLHFAQIIAKNVINI